jgi:hypothetical protein
VFWTLNRCTIFGKKIKFEQGISKKNYRHKQKFLKKWSYRLEMAPPPPHFSNGPSLITVLTASFSSLSLGNWYINKVFVDNCNNSYSVTLINVMNFLQHLLIPKHCFNHTAFLFIRKNENWNFKVRYSSRTKSKLLVLL